MNQSFILIFIILIVALFTLGCSMGGVNIQNTEEIIVEKQPIKLGYCPTMSGIAKEIGVRNPQVSLVSYSFTAQALQSLNNNKVDVVLVGRKAEKSEIESVNERIIGEGHTLVTRTKKSIQENELINIKIHTAIEEKIAKQMLPKTEIIFHSTIQEAINQGLQEAVLIDWDNYKDEFELLVVLKGMGKSEKFRIPILYSKSYDLERINI